MSRWVGVAAVLLGLAAVGEGAWIWHLRQAAGTASIKVHATNAGIELGASDGRVFVHPSGRVDRLAAEGGLGQSLELEPGSYDVRVVFSRARDGQSSWLRNLTLASGQALARTVEFSSGELNVEVLDGSEQAQAVVYVYAHGNRDEAVTSMASDEPVLIAPGVYDVRVVLVDGSEEEDISWREEVPVKAGLQTRVRVPFHRGSLLVEARNGGEPLPGGAVELTVYRAGDADRAVFETGLAGTPLGLAAGRYDIRAIFSGSHDKPERWLHDIAVEAGSTVTHGAEFASGTVVVTARLTGGEALDRFQAYVYFYAAGDHRQPVAYTTAPDPAVLEGGRYDVRVSFFRSHDRPDLWLRDLDVLPGERVTRTVEFASGRLLVRAFDPAGNELIGDTVFVHVHAAGEHARAVAVARSGETLTLSAGHYDLRTMDSRSPGAERWVHDVQIYAGRLVEHAVDHELPASPHIAPACGPACVGIPDNNEGSVTR